VRHLTGLYAQTACSAVWVSQNTSRRKRLCGILLHHIFAVAETASQFLYRNRKNVIYLFALGDSCATTVQGLKEALM
jgi:hypothetical protein